MQRRLQAAAAIGSWKLTECGGIVIRPGRSVPRFRFPYTNGLMQICTQRPASHRAQFTILVQRSLDNLFMNQHLSFTFKVHLG